MFLLFFILWVSFALFAFIFHSFSCPFSFHFILFSFLFLFPALSSPSCISPNCLVRFIVFYAFLSFYFFVRCNFSQCKTNAPEKKKLISVDLSDLMGLYWISCHLVGLHGLSWCFMWTHVNSWALMNHVVMFFWPKKQNKNLQIKNEHQTEKPWGYTTTSANVTSLEASQQFKTK